MTPLQPIRTRTESGVDYLAFNTTAKEPWGVLGRVTTYYDSADCVYREDWEAEDPMFNYLDCTCQPAGATPTRDFVRHPEAAA